MCRERCDCDNMPRCQWSTCSYPCIQKAFFSLGEPHKEDGEGNSHIEREGEMLGGCLPGNRAR